MKRILPALLISCAAILQAQTPVITAVSNESGSTAICPGGVAFVKGTNLGDQNSVVTFGAKNAFVFNGSSTSLQMQVPVDLALGATTVKVGTSAAFNVTIVQYCPGMPIDNSVTNARHYPSGILVTTAFPATPGEQITLSATGLGATNPQAATGVRAQDENNVVLVKPTLSLGGSSVPVTKAFASPDNAPGFYSVLFTVPASFTPPITTGSPPISISIGGLTSNVGSLPFTTAPVISSMSNAASLLTAGPGRGIAQGAIFILKGVLMGPTDLVISPTPFQVTTVGGTSVSVTSGGTTTPIPLYYTSAGQIAGLMPSNVVSGNATAVVTYNGQTSAAFSFFVATNTLGIFTVTSDGAGAGIVTYPDYSLVSTTKATNCGGVYTTCGAANPGDVLIIWATGLGAIQGTDASGAGLGVNQPTLPLTIYLGNVAVSASYQGRSGCCVGEDQIVFTVPANAPLGCAVPLMVQMTQSNGFIATSNGTSMAIAAKGSRTCTPANPVYSAAQVVQSTTVSPFTFGEIRLSKDDNFLNGGTGFQDNVQSDFVRFTVPSAVQPFFFSYADMPPVGSCSINARVDFNTPDPPVASFAVLDAGAKLTIQGPNGTQAFSASGTGFSGLLSNNGTYLAPGTLTLSTAGGKDVPAFSTSLTIPVMPVMTSPAPDTNTLVSVTRANGLPVSWTGGTADGLIMLDGIAATDNTFNFGASFHCLVSAASGSFTVPASILLAMPASNFAGLRFAPLVGPKPVTGTPLLAFGVGVTYNYGSLLMMK